MPSKRILQCTFGVSERKELVARLSGPARTAAVSIASAAVCSTRAAIIASMEVEQSAPQGPPPAPELPTLSLPVLAIVKDAQGLHGLKHSDYQRYRQASVLHWCHRCSSTVF